MVAQINALVQAVANALVPVVISRTTTLTGTGLDLADYEGMGLLVLHGVRATGDLTPTIEESDLVGSAYALARTNVFAGFTVVNSGTDFIQAVVIDVTAAKRFIRFIGTASNTPSHTYGATFYGMKKYR